MRSVITVPASTVSASPEWSSSQWLTEMGPGLHVTASGEPWMCESPIVIESRCTPASSQWYSNSYLPLPKSLQVTVRAPVLAALNRSPPRVDLFLYWSIDWTSNDPVSPTAVFSPCARCGGSSVASAEALAGWTVSM